MFYVLECLSSCLSFALNVFLSVDLYVCLFVCRPVILSICMSLCPPNFSCYMPVSICLYVYVSSCLSVKLSFKKSMDRNALVDTHKDPPPVVRRGGGLNHEPLRRKQCFFSSRGKLEKKQNVCTTKV